MTLRFGTDGVRGRAYDELSLADVTQLARAIARVLPSEKVVIGRDTRLSGPDFVAALAAGLAHEGARAGDLGVAPTPMVAYAARTESIPGLVVSASHNSYVDNGVKVFAPGGRKLADDTQAELESELGRLTGNVRESAPPVAEVGVAGAYVASVIDSIEGRDLSGLRVVLDCANGAASHLVPDALRHLGAEVTTIHAEPDGRNINDGCGSTHPADLRRAVVDRGASVGLAFDGDADRVIAVDELGGVVDGDHIMAMAAIDLHGRGRLSESTVVATVMANLGFRLAMGERGIRVVETPVGDRHVLAALDANEWSLGGEQSGHVIFHDLATTGDGFLTGLQVLDLSRRRGEPLSVMAAEAMTSLPQVLENVPVSSPVPDIADRLAEELVAAEDRLGTTGRVLVRPSGTEPVVRVMVEAGDEAEARVVVAELVAAVEAAAR